MPTVTPSGWWHFVGGALIAVGIIGGIVLIVLAIVDYTDRIDDFARVDVPGSATVQLDGTGGYSVYYEDRYSSISYLSSGVDVEITAPDGSNVLLDRYDSEVSYTSGSYSGEGLFTFDAPEPGAYQVTVSGDEDSDDDQIAIGRGVGRGLATQIVLGVVLGFVGVVAGAVIIIVTAVKRGGSKRRQRASASGWSGGGYPPAGPTYPPGPPPGSPPSPGAPPPSSPPPPPGSGQAF